MTDTPRVRLKSLMDGLTLPKGFKLTPVREKLLRALGMHMLQEGPLKCYGPRVNVRSVQGSWRWASGVSSAEKAALRGMNKAGWVKAVTREEVVPGRSYRWVTHDVVFQEGIEQLAKRLGARQILWQERRQTGTEMAEEALREMREKLYEARRIMAGVSHNPTLNDNDVLETYKKLREATAEVSEAELELERVKTQVGEIPQPTEDEAFSWLMQRELTRHDKR